jgi:hypothetical protein
VAEFHSGRSVREDAEAALAVETEVGARFKGDGGTDGAAEVESAGDDSNLGSVCERFRVGGRSIDLTGVDFAAAATLDGLCGEIFDTLEAARFRGGAALEAASTD